MFCLAMLSLHVSGPMSSQPRQRATAKLPDHDDRIASLSKNFEPITCRTFFRLFSEEHPTSLRRGLHHPVLHRVSSVLLLSPYPPAMRRSGQQTRADLSPN